MRITKKMKEEYEKVKKNTRTKVRNTMKNMGTAMYHDVERTIDKEGNPHYEVVQKDIRKQLNIPSIESFTSKKEFDEFINNQKKFTSGRSPHAKFSKVNEKGTVMTDYAKLVLENKHAKAEKERIKQMKRLENAGLKDAAAKESFMMKNPTVTEFKPIPFSYKYMWNQGDIERALIGLTVKGSPKDFDEKRQRLKDNFIRAMEFAFNSEADELIQMIKEMPAADFYVLYASEEYNKYFDIRYIPSPQKSLHFNETQDQAVLDRSLGQMRDVIEKYWDNKLDDKAFLLMDF